MPRRKNAADRTKNASAADKSKPKRKHTQAELDNLARGRKKRTAMLEESDGTEDTPKERWAKLLDGTLTVPELDDEEVDRMRVKGKGGLFNGRKRALPSSLYQAFRNEQIKRTRAILAAAGRPAAAALQAIGEDPKAKDSDRIRALMAVLDHSIGKAPETVHVVGEDKWSKVLDGALVDDRDMDGSRAPDDASDLA